MGKLIAMTALVAALACGSGSNEIAPVPGRTSAVITGGTCTNAPNDCGVRVCVDCTAGAPPGTEPACVGSKCVFPCAAGFHKCGTECVPESDPSACGPQCVTCGAPENGAALCVSGSCDFNCNLGFAKSGPACLSLSFSLSY